MKTPEYTPTHLRPWSLPDSYFGATWEDYFVFLGQNRDSDCLTRSNFRCGLSAIGGENGESILVVHESHWACGWVEWIAIHKDSADALRKADEIAAALEDYPVVDEMDFSELETEEADETWKNCYSPKERIAYIRKNRYQFEFRDFADMLGCARGDYFAGYASELLY